MVIWLSATIVEILGQLNKCKITIFCGNLLFWQYRNFVGWQ